MIDAATIDAMLASGCSAEQIGAVVKAALAADEARAEALRAKAAAKKRRQRAAAGQGVLPEMSPDVPGTSGDNGGQSGTLASPLPSPCPPSPVTPNPLNPQPSPLHTTAAARERGPNPVVVLGSVLDAFNAKRFADHCTGKRRPLSAEQAEAVVAELKAVRDAGGNPVEAINLAIGRGWTSIRREWLADKPQGGGGQGGGSGAPRASHGGAAQANANAEMAALARLTGWRNERGSGAAGQDFGGGGPVVDLVPNGGRQQLG